MKKLTRMLLINWHFFTKDLIQFDRINHLVGENASGKSTIIDAIQHIILADKAGFTFNKAANESSSRNIKGYLFGQIGDDGDASFTYKRNGSFSSYVVLEYQDSDSGKYFLLGSVFDCEGDLSFKHDWFTVEEYGLPSSLFVDPDTDIPFNRKELKCFLADEAETNRTMRARFYSADKEFSRDELVLMGSLQNTYTDLFRKAVPFALDTKNIEDFITRYLCNIDSNTQQMAFVIEQMKDSNRHFLDLERECNTVKEKLTDLEAIQAKNAEAVNAASSARQNGYIHLALKLSHANDQLSALKSDIALTKEKSAALKAAIATDEAERTNLDKDYEALIAKRSQNEAFVKGKRLEEEIKTLCAEAKALTLSAEGALDGIRGFADKAMQAIGQLAAGDEPLSFDESFFSSLSNLDCTGLAKLSIKATKEKITHFTTTIRERHDELLAESRQAQHDLARLKEEIHALTLNQHPYRDDLNAFRAVLESRGIESHVLAEELEIRDESYRAVIESVLQRRRFALFVEEEKAEECTRLYQSFAKEHKDALSFPLIDVPSLLPLSQDIIKGSLADEIIGDGPIALYAGLLLSPYRKCTDISVLDEQYASSTSLIKDPFDLSAPDTDAAETPYIGGKALALQKERKEKEAAEVSAKEDLRLCRIARLSKAMIPDELVPNAYQLEDYRMKAEGEEKAKEKEAQVATKREELESFDFDQVNTLNAQIDLVRIKRKSLEDRYGNEKVQLGIIINALSVKESERLPALESEEAEIRKQLDTGFPAEERTRFAPIASAIIDQSKNKDEAIREYLDKKEKAEFKRVQSLTQLSKARNLYNITYKAPFDPESEDNSEYDTELTSLKDNRLPRYEQQIKEGKEKTFSLLKNDFISKMKGNFDTVETAIKRINKALSGYKFGVDRYTYECSPNKSYLQFYRMFTDDMMLGIDGANLFSDPFFKKYEREIDELFKKFSEGEGKGSNDYKTTIERYANCLTYLNFDLIVTHDNGSRERLSKTLKTKSGGETQQPFYITLLMSFVQCCRIDQKVNNNTSRLIVFDEAFSKMDGSRIEESVKLLKDFDLQVIFSTPPEKFPNIARFTDRTIIVQPDKKNYETRATSFRTGEVSHV